MVAWSQDDALAITAVSDWTLKIWDSHRGTLLKTLTGHENDIFVLEPHPIALNLLLTAAHDGHIIGKARSLLKIIQPFLFRRLSNAGHF